MIDYETLLYGPIFDAAYGVAATYTPPSGGVAVACTVIRDRRDVQPLDFGVGRPVLQGNIVKVRKSEIESPAKGGTFVIDGESWTVAEDPQCEESERLVWTMAVREA